MNGDFGDLTWSPDSRWLAYSETADNQFDQIKMLNIDSGAIQAITSDRYNSVNPIWSSDGKWLYFLSDRNLKTTIRSPWGPREPEPHFDRSVKIYELALTPGLRSPFLPADELHPDNPRQRRTKKRSTDDKAKDAKTQPQARQEAADADKTARKKDDNDETKKDEKKPAEVKIDFTDLASRLDEVPAPPETTIRCRPPTSASAGSMPATTAANTWPCNAWTSPTRATKSTRFSPT